MVAVPIFGVGVEHREIELLFLGIEIDKQVVDFVEDFLRPSIRTIDLVNNDDGRQVRFERFAEHVPRLRKRTFTGVDEQHHAIDHFKRALDLASKIAVAGCVDDIDFYVVVKNGGIFCENGDAALAFEFVRVHDALDVVLVGAKRATLLQHGIDQRGLAVVDVGDDCDIANA